LLLEFPVLSVVEASPAAYKRPSQGCWRELQQQRFFLWFLLLLEFPVLSVVEASPAANEGLLFRQRHLVKPRLVLQRRQPGYFFKYFPEGFIVDIANFIHDFTDAFTAFF